ncbi:hypothetical protein [Wenxinia marina]|uniref:FTP domain-containing protein n=1 Tax=Wenxinia marina DSM 24838 TaxID=1123501 RepID=A0A0D0PHH1_9RHOB|nr:hypothetical protein [Wenxinia marina]KIQ70801.1 hypothetical protein Wenmar_00175 [Wenxinia marina DSM 24838]
MLRTLAALCLTLAALPARAETFDVLLGDRLIGTMESRADLLRTVLDNTPFGIADGETVATLGRVQADDGAVVSQYYFRNDERTVSVLFADDGSVRQTEILPQSEATEMSDPARYPADVRDPVGVVHGMVTAGGVSGPVPAV